MMRVEIPASLFDDDECYESLLQLILFFRDVRHEWVISPLDVDTVSNFFDRNLSAPLAQTYSAIVKKASRAGYTWAPVEDRRPVLRVARGTLEEDVEDLRRPAVLVVENRKYDWMFISAVAKLLGMEDILRAEDANLLDVRNGGGADGAVSEAVDQVRRFTRTKRVVLVIDSDRYRPGERTKNHTRAESVADAGGYAHVLEFRELENYVPNRVLARQARRRGHAHMSTRLQALKKLTHVQRAHFDMKNGFKEQQAGTAGWAERKSTSTGDPSAAYHIPRQHGDLYHGVNEGTLITLRKGFGTSLPKLFLDEVGIGGISEKDLDGLGLNATEELRKVLDTILDII
ncbi:hypothetical protein ACFOVU_24155 [Nocardiopsis sediminis]|uniref:Uncharacterized protein n=1 Tax=Nocardiopsis sediminis TaxID=1778267 RepID=A0ABV8FWZ9_9ACTN